MSARTPTRTVRRGRFTRRELLHLAQVAAAGGAVLGLAATAGKASADEKRGVCRICTMHCGIVATVEGGRLTRVEGDRASSTNGFLCHHGQALREIVHAASRVRRPMVRIGDELHETSWDDALGELSARLRKVVDAYGPEAVVVQTGWPFVRHPLVPILRRFCHALGTPNLTSVASFCEASGRIGRALVTGSRLRPDLTNARTLLVWGANPPVSSPPFAHVVAGFGRPGRTLIVVDPIRTELADRATLHLQPLPGSDGALALGLLQVLIAERLYDERVVREETHGFEELAALAAGWTPEKVEQVTGVPAGDVVRAARLFAGGGPAATWEGLGVEHHTGGVSTVRAITALSAICGHIGVEGGDLPIDPVEPGDPDPSIPVIWRLTTPEPVPPAPKALPLGYAEYPLQEIFNRQAQGNLIPRAVLEGRPYPVRALIGFGSNPLLTSPGGARVREALGRLDLLVSVDPFLSATGELSDVVLPAATFVEGQVLSDDDRLVARSAVLTEQGEARTDFRIVVELARALGLGSYFPFESLEEYLGARAVPWTRGERTITRASGKTPWPTPTGKLELSSVALLAHGLDPLPTFHPPVEQPDPAYPLLLVTGPRTRHYLNSQFRTVPAIRDRGPAPVARLHPGTAAPLRVLEGSRVRVTTRRGAVELAAQLDDRVLRGVLVLPSGWAAPEVNLLTDTEALDPISGFPPFRSGACKVEPV